MKTNIWEIAGCILLGMGAFCLQKSGEKMAIAADTTWKDATDNKAGS